MASGIRRELWCVPGPADHDYYESLYNHASRFGLSVRFAAELSEIPSETSDAIIHAHWLSIWGLTSTEQARRQASEDIGALDNLLARNCRLIWTVHEPLPHNPYHRYEETRFRQALADRASVVHFLTDVTIERSAGILEFSETGRLTTAVPSAVDHVEVESHGDARRALGLPDDVDVLLIPGNIKLYKEPEVLARAVLRRQTRGTERPCIALVVGALLPGVDAAVERLRNLGAAVITKTLPQQAFHRLLSAVDAIVLPYSAGLNSGVMAMGLGAGTPVAPSTQLLSPQFDFVDDRYFFDMAVGDGAIDEAIEWVLKPTARQDFARYAAIMEKRFSAHGVADDFFSQALELLDNSTLPSFDPLQFQQPIRKLHERFLLARAQKNPLVRSMSMTHIAELAHADHDAALEWDARTQAVNAGGMRTGIVENAQRLLQLGNELGDVAAAERTVHKMIDGHMESLGAVAEMAATMSASEPRFETTSLSLKSRLTTASAIPQQWLLAQSIESQLIGVL